MVTPTISENFWPSGVKAREKSVNESRHQPPTDRRRSLNTESRAPLNKAIVPIDEITDLINLVRIFIQILFQNLLVVRTKQKTNALLLNLVFQQRVVFLGKRFQLINSER
jgi:hypothetical protein